MDATLQEMCELRNRLEEAIDNRDAETAERCAHTIKGSAAAIAARQIKALAAALEKAAASKDLTLAGKQLPGLKRGIEELIRRCGDC